MSVERKEIGERIREARIAAKMTQNMLAEKLGISPYYISRIELGKNNFTVDKLIKLTEVLGVSADWLLRSNVQESLPIISQDVSELLSDCSAAERTALFTVLTSTKAALRDYSSKLEEKLENK